MNIYWLTHLEESNLPPTGMKNNSCCITENKVDKKNKKCEPKVSAKTKETETK
jgi:hypothetical protein